MVSAIKQAELPPLKGYLRTPLGFYVANHKAPVGMTWGKTAEWHQSEGEILIPNSYWSRVAMLTKEELEAIENPDVRNETAQAQELMLKYPAQFVNLMVIGNKTLIEPHGLGVRVLDQKLKTDDIGHYDHDVSKIILGKPQASYNNAKLLVDESAKNDDIRFAVRGGDWYADDRRFNVHLDYGPRNSGSDVAGLGFRPSGNQAYFDAKQALEELEDAATGIANARELLR